MKGFFILTKENLKSAIVYGVLTIVVTLVGVSVETILEHGSIFGLDWAKIIDKSVIATLGALVAFISVIKNLLTNHKGEFLGLMEVIPDKDKK